MSHTMSDHDVDRLTKQVRSHEYDAAWCKAFREGQAARDAEKPSEPNPYSKNFPGSAWEEGWWAGWCNNDYDRLRAERDEARKEANRESGLADHQAKGCDVLGEKVAQLESDLAASRAECEALRAAIDWRERSTLMDIVALTHETEPTAYYAHWCQIGNGPMQTTKSFDEPHKVLLAAHAAATKGEGNG